MHEQVRNEVKLSRAASSLWGKTDDGECEAWLPLFVHLADTSNVGRFLWRRWVPSGTRGNIARDMGVSEELAEKAVVLLTGLHDLGKATPSFQGRVLRYGGAVVENPFSAKLERCGLSFSMPDFVRQNGNLKHAWCSAAFVLSYLCPNREGLRTARGRAAKSYASVVALHHGTTPSVELSYGFLSKHRRLLGVGDDGWESARLELISLVERIAGVTERDYGALLGVSPSGSYGIPPHVGVLIEGICIMADWLASNADFFPLLPMVPRTSEGRDLQQGRFSLEGLEARAQAAFVEMDILPPWHGPNFLEPDIAFPFSDRFQFPKGSIPRPIQSDAVSLAKGARNPGLMVIEAPMGEGKTEAALAVAEIFAVRSGRGGVVVALPTMATTDAMFGRVRRWLDRLPQPAGEEARSIYLAHGKARLNEEFQGIIARSRSTVRKGTDEVRSSEGLSLSEYISQCDEVVASDWLFGRKKGLLANFVVCTIDQVLMGALSMRHLALRDLGLANKVVVIDECHAYDAYMQVYLGRILEWLGSWGTPVVLLSATLPVKIRSMLLSSYGKGCKAACPDLASEKMSWECAAETSYPLITLFDGGQVISQLSKAASKHHGVTLSCMDDALGPLVSLLRRITVHGGCVGVVCNTVYRAQAAADALSKEFGDEVVLTHSRFTDFDRMERERWLREVLGPEATRENGRRPHRVIVVGTQVLEQSLDIDFDALVTDIAPVDLVFQRLGRMHRHQRGREDRPSELIEPRCFVRGVAEWGAGAPDFDAGVAHVYGTADLYESLAVLGLTGLEREAVVDIPGDIAPMVGLAYGDDRGSIMPPSWLKSYYEADEMRAEQMETKRAKAEYCLVESPARLIQSRDTLYQWCRKTGADQGAHHGGRVRDADWGPRAVRDTDESVEVILLRRDGRYFRLLPWIGNGQLGVEVGAMVPTGAVPEYGMQKVIASSSVRLPMSLCAPDKLDELISELEGRCGSLIGAWGDASLLAGSLVLVLNEDSNGRYSTTLNGSTVSYSHDTGLTISC